MFPQRKSNELLIWLNLLKPCTSIFYKHKICDNYHRSRNTATISEAKQYYPHFNIFIRLVTQLASNCREKGAKQPKLSYSILRSWASLTK